MLAVIAAMENEIAGLRRSMTIDGIDRRGSVVIHRGLRRGKPFLLVKSGVGKQNAVLTFRALADSFPLTAVLSIGLAGALDSALKVGEVVVCSKMVCAEESYPVCICDSRLLAMAQSCKGSSLGTFVGVTALHLVASAGEKTALRRASNADVVDMESYWISRMAAEENVPCLVARAVSDGAGDSLPHLPSWRPVHTIPYIVAHPVQGLRLYGAIEMANKRMTAFALKVIEAVA